MICSYFQVCIFQSPFPAFVWFQLFFCYFVFFSPISCIDILVLFTMAFLIEIFHQQNSLELAYFFQLSLFSSFKHHLACVQSNLHGKVIPSIFFIAIYLRLYSELLHSYTSTLLSPHKHTQQMQTLQAHALNEYILREEFPWKHEI